MISMRIGHTNWSLIIKRFVCNVQIWSKIYVLYSIIMHTTLQQFHNKKIMDLSHFITMIYYIQSGIFIQHLNNYWSRGSRLNWWYPFNQSIVGQLWYFVMRAMPCLQPNKRWLRIKQLDFICFWCTHPRVQISP